jgi:hypothetical protein
VKRILVLLALVVTVGVGVYAQTDSDAHNVVITIAPIAALDLNDNTTDVTFTTTAPLLAGNDPGPTAGAPATDVSKRLWYTAASLGAATREITVQSDVAAPAGTTLTVDAAGAEGGVNAGPITIGVGAQNLVTGITSIATGRTGGDGAGLTYSFWVSNAALLVVGVAPTTMVVTYTLNED